jgi:hypothetical protein
MNRRTVGLRFSSVTFGLLSLGLISRVWAQREIVIGSYHVGRFPSWISIIIAGGLAIWLAKLAGPWCAEAKETPLPKI